MDALLTIEQLKYQRHHQILFQNLTFTINPGEILAIYGGVNSGKTVVADMIAGFTKPGGGRISGTARMTVATQQTIFYPDLTVRENLEFCAVINNFPEVKLKEIITATGLDGWERQRSGRLPAVLKPMLHLAGALAREFDLLVLDETTTGLDTSLKQIFWKLMFQLRDEGKGILLLTGQWEDALRCQSIVNLPSGERQPGLLQPTFLGFPTQKTAGFEYLTEQVEKSIIPKLPDGEIESGEVVL